MVSDYLSKYCTYYLSRYSVSKKKFENILKKKIKKDFFNKKINEAEFEILSQEIKGTIEFYKKSGLFNEKEMVRSKVNYLIKKGFSRRKIMVYLKKEFFETEIIKKETSFINHDQEFDSKQIETFMRKKRLKKGNRPNNLSKENLDKILRRLLQEGFGFNDCQNYLKNN